MFEVIMADENDQLIECNCDGTIFYLHISWNETAGQFSLGLQTAEAETLIENVVMVTGYPLFYRFRHPFMPLGDFMVIRNRDIEPTRRSFLDGSATLVYLTQQDLIDNNVLEKYGQI